MATSFDISSLLKKSDLADSDQPAVKKVINKSSLSQK